VDTVSHSKDWKSTAIFVTEDDAQAGPDHVDAHRTTSWVISPYTQTGKVDSTFYSQVSMLRTIELLAGTGPMTQFDAYATPMTNAFTNKPDFTPYNAKKPPYSTLNTNPKDGPMASWSAKQTWTHTEGFDSTEKMNKALWKFGHCDGPPMPAPQHHVFSADSEDDDD
jgi:hypothetical protein